MLFMLGFLLTACKNNPSTEKTIEPETEEIEKVNYVYWNVKAILPDGKNLDVKAFDPQGKSFDIMAMQDSDQDVFLDVKAIAGEEKLPVKMLVKDEQFAPVAAITDDGDTYELKAITAEGEKLDIKGIRRFGNIIIMKAITNEGKYIGLKAISPDGQQNDIKGIKINIREREMTLKGVSVHAHVKAMHPAANEDKFKMYKKSEVDKKREYKTDFERIPWNLNAITADGKKLVVKAIDAEGNQFDVQATQDSKQHSFMNIKAFAEKHELAVKIMDSTDDEYSPIKAIGGNGIIYDIKAITEEGEKLDIKGVSRSGIIINVKAINENGDFYDVKAFAPNGTSNEVKGIKIFDRKVEMKIQGHPVYAHLKAINQ